MSTTSVPTTNTSSLALPQPLDDLSSRQTKRTNGKQWIRSLNYFAVLGLSCVLFTLSLWMGYDLLKKAKLLGLVMFLFAISLTSLAIFIDWLIFGTRLLQLSHSPTWNKTNEYVESSFPINVDCYSKRCFRQLKLICARISSTEKHHLVP